MTDFSLTAEQQFASPSGAAVFYNRLGWEPLVLPERKKAPKGPDALGKHAVLKVQGRV